MHKAVKTAAMAAVFLLGAPLAFAQDAPSLPGGASSLQETFDDWQVNCATQQSKVLCSMVQNQIDSQSRQRVLAVEINALNGDTASGLALLPFGLALATPVTLQVDDGAPIATIPFRTCLPVGCIVPITFDGATVNALKAGTALKLAAIADGGNPANFSVSLKGFSKALDRVSALTK